MTLEQIANWKSQQNPLEKVYGKEGLCPTLDTRCDCSCVVVKGEEDYD